MFYALSRLEEFYFQKKIDKFIAIAPCTKANHIISNYPEWQETLYRNEVRAITSDIELKEAKEVIDYFGLTADYEPISVKAIAHLEQITFSDRF